ncbi:MAG: DHA2 family efflux MFS transporter permease subunit [Microbacterium sp.]|uniref:DHA2 family efflux MFS transporter permease subunit n=1 Tax=Microbacterium sp. TaxID=51671 RepID=UPI0039E4BED7
MTAAMSAAAFLAVLTGTTVTSTLESLGEALDVTLSGTVWITTTYLVAASAAVPLIGWLTARLGPARVLQLALVGFAAGSLLCGLAWDLASMVAFRAVQGLFGGMLEPAAVAIVGIVTPAASMGRVMGLVSLVINLGPVAGPLLGGALTGVGAWRWIFWLNVPIAIVVGLAAWRLMPDAERRADRSVRVDVIGIALLPPGFVLMLLGMNRWGAGADAGIVIACVAAGAAMLALYVPHALRAAEPLLDLRLLRAPAFTAALGVMSAVGFIMYTQLTVLPLAAERLGLDAGWRALPVAALGTGLMISMTLAGRLSDRTGPRPPVAAGASLTALAAAAVAVGNASWGPAALLAVLLVLGLGFGAIAAPTFASIYRVLPKTAVGQGTAALFIVVQLFAAVGVTLVGFLVERAAQPVDAAYGLVAVAALAVAAASVLLPARPAPAAG